MGQGSTDQSVKNWTRLGESLTEENRRNKRAGAGPGIGQTRARVAPRGTVLAPLSARATMPRPLGAFYFRWREHDRSSAKRDFALRGNSQRFQGKRCTAVARQTRSQGLALKTKSWLAQRCFILPSFHLASRWAGGGWSD